MSRLEKIAKRVTITGIAGFALIASSCDLLGSNSGTNSINNPPSLEYFIDNGDNTLGFKVTDTDGDFLTGTINGQNISQYDTDNTGNLEGNYPITQDGQYLFEFSDGITSNSKEIYGDYTEPKNPDITAPHSPSIQNYLDFDNNTQGHLLFDLINNGDDNSNVSTENVSGIESIILRAMPVQGNFTENEILNYGLEIGTYTDDTRISKPGFRPGANYSIYAITKDVAQNKDISFIGNSTADNLMPPLHTFYGTTPISQGTINVYGQYLGERSLIDSFNFTNDFYNVNFVSAAEDIVLEINGIEKTATYIENGVTQLDF